jgi:Cu(I)/Ag(I) efflux system membrane fusion protein
MTGHDHGGMKMAVDARADADAMPEKISLGPEGKDALQPLYTHYLALKDALVSDDFDGAKEKARALQNSVQAVDMKVFTGPAHTAWMQYSNALTNALEHAAHFSNIEAVRKAFQPVSNTMIDMSQTMEPFDQTLYVQHCPMADDFKGADWLSLSDEIRNPYFGDQMLRCGEVTGTIQ